MCGFIRVYKTLVRNGFLFLFRDSDLVRILIKRVDPGLWIQVHTHQDGKRRG